MSLESPFSPLPVPSVALHRKFFEYFTEHSGKIYMVDGTSGKEFTYKDVLESSKRVASGLVKLGVQKGDVFALYSFNSPELVIMMWAVFAAGATVISLNPAHTATQLKAQLVDSGAKFIYISPGLSSLVNDDIKEIIPPKNIVVSSEDADLMSFKRLIEDDCSQWQYLERMEFKPHEDSLIILYTSGTTGKPKGVILTHYNVLYNSIQHSHPEVAGPLCDICTIVVSPLYHGFPFLTCVIGLMRHGAKLIIHEIFEAEKLLQAVEDHKVNLLYVVVSTVVQLAKSPVTEKYDLSSLQHIYSTGAHLHREVENAFCCKMGLENVKQAYGMTEGAFFATDIFNKISPDGSVGVLVPGLKDKVVDQLTGESLGPLKHGELCVRSPSIMTGYLNRPDATRKTIDSEGWLHTGDIAYYDKRQYIYIVGRITEMFKVYELQVSPSELEGIIFKHPSVLDVGVVGIPDEITSSKPKAFVVKKPQCHVTEQELCEHVAAVSAQYKWLTGGVQFVNEIPRSPTGKIVRRQLQEMAL